MITALVLLDRKIADIIKGVEVASVLLISVVGRVLVRVLRPYTKKAGASILHTRQKDYIPVLTISYVAKEYYQ